MTPEDRAIVQTTHAQEMRKAVATYVPLLQIRAKQARERGALPSYVVDAVQQLIEAYHLWTADEDRVLRDAQETTPA